VFKIKKLICFTILENEANIEPIKEMITKLWAFQQKNGDLIFKNDAVIKETISENKPN
jgi:hypothetical protein